MPSLRRHARFLAALVLGLAVLAATWALGMKGQASLLLAANAFFVSYLALELQRAAVTDETTLRRNAADEDEGLPLILILAVAIVAVVLGSIFMLLNDKGADPVLIVLAMAAVPLGWAMLHVLAAFHYARIYYADATEGALTFPGGNDSPTVWDFFYFSFVIGMTAQVSDVEITTSSLRKKVLAHSIFSFFYNTVIVALAVNAAISLGK